MSSDYAKPILQSRVKEREEEVDRERGRKTIIKSEQEWTLPAQLGQLNTGHGERDCCKAICGTPMTFQSYGIK